SAQGKPSEWANQVTIEHLMSHNALNMHYVNGVALNSPMPKIAAFLKGNSDYGYAPVEVINEPGTKFQYSGGGFLVLEHLIETLGKKSIDELTRPFLDQLGLHDFSFNQKNRPGVDYAKGYKDNGEEIKDSRLMFPAFAA